MDEIRYDQIRQQQMKFSAKENQNELESSLED